MQEIESELAIIREENDKFSQEIRQYQKDFYDLNIEKQQIRENYEIKLAEVREITEREKCKRIMK